MRRIMPRLTAAVLVAGLAACGLGAMTRLGRAERRRWRRRPPSRTPRSSSTCGQPRAGGLKLEIVEFDRLLPAERGAQDGQLDANYFQHPPYLAEQEEARNFGHVGRGVHLEPLGVYSQKVKASPRLPRAPRSRSRTTRPTVAGR